MGTHQNIMIRAFMIDIMMIMKTKVIIIVVIMPVSFKHLRGNVYLHRARGGT